MKDIIKMANQNLKFKYPCFIRKNSQGLRDKLEDLGYTLNVFDEDGFGQYLCVGGKTYISTWSIEDNIRLNCIDCDINEDLFIAIAAIRDDTDYGQWFKIPITKMLNALHQLSIISSIATPAPVVISRAGIAAITIDAKVVFFLLILNLSLIAVETPSTLEKAESIARVARHK